MKTCPLCDRELDELSTDKHHLIPKTFKGKDVVLLHKICHRKIHATLTERELLKTFHTVESLRAHPEISKFITWVSKKPPSFYDCSIETNVRKNKRRR
jgi:hypothetical protein